MLFFGIALLVWPDVSKGVVVALFAVLVFADALIKLRNRTSRNDNQANNGQGATGMSLSAEDATFLIREAARADGLRTALEACYKQYDEVK